MALGEEPRRPSGEGTRPVEPVERTHIRVTLRERRQRMKDPERRTGRMAERADLLRMAPDVERAAHHLMVHVCPREHVLPVCVARVRPVPDGAGVLPQQERQHVRQINLRARALGVHAVAADMVLVVRHRLLRAHAAGEVQLEPALREIERPFAPFKPEAAVKPHDVEHAPQRLEVSKGHERIESGDVVVRRVVRRPRQPEAPRYPPLLRNVPRHVGLHAVDEALVLERRIRQGGTKCDVAPGRIGRTERGIERGQRAELLLEMRAECLRPFLRRLALARPLLRERHLEHEVRRRVGRHERPP